MRVLAIALAAAFIGCRHKAPYVQPPPSWRWADLGKVCMANSPSYPIPDTLRDTSSHPFKWAHGNDWEDKASLTRDIPGGFGGIGFHRKMTRPVKFGKVLDDNTFTEGLSNAPQHRWCPGSATTNRQAVIDDSHKMPQLASPRFEVTKPTPSPCNDCIRPSLVAYFQL